MSKSSFYVKESLAIAERVIKDGLAELDEGEPLMADEAIAIKASLAEIERLVWLVGVQVDVLDVRKLVREVN